MNALPLSSPADVWANLRRLYPVYCTLAREFVIDVEPCIELEDAHESPATEAITQAGKWFAGMDEKIQIQHLRQFVQTSSEVSEPVLRDLLLHSLSSQQRDRDKVDFLLVQLFSEHAPENCGEADLTLEAVAKVLETVLGPVEIETSQFLKELHALLYEAKEIRNLNSLFTARVIERGRDIKAACGDKFFEPLTMVAFARFGFLMRRRFFRLLHQELNLIVEGLRQLEARGLMTLDCRKAEFSREEPVNRLRMICQSWKVMFQAEYSAGQPLSILVDLRMAVEAALKQSAGLPKAKAAAARASCGPREFEVRGPAASNANFDHQKQTE